MDPMLAEFRRVAGSIAYRPAQMDVVSNVSGEAAGSELSTADYWVRHVREAVRFAAGVGALHARGVTEYVELGPRPTLLGLIPACLPAGAKAPALVASLRPERRETAAALEALGSHYAQGGRVEWTGVFPRGGARVDLPTYPWQRQRYWIEASALPAHRARGTTTGHPLLRTRITAAGVDAIYEATLSLSDQPWLADHRLGEQVIVPGMAVAELVRAAAEYYLEDTPQVRDLVLSAPLVLEAGKARRVQVVVSKKGTRAQVYSQPAEEMGPCWIFHSTADIALRQPSAAATVDVEALRRRCAKLLDVAALYEDFAIAGVHYGPVFRGVRGLSIGTGEALGEIHLPAAAKARGYGMHPALFDAALQVARHAVPSGDGAAWVPFAMGQLVIYEPGRREALVHARLANGRGGAPVIDILVMDAAGMPIAELSGLRYRRADALSAFTTRPSAKSRRPSRALEHVRDPSPVKEPN
jgi:polyketide synthase 12/epothilone polyketide synthase D